MTTSPPLSAIVATTQPWPEVAPCLESLHGQIDAIGGEVVLGDGSATGMPAGLEGRYPRLRVLRRPGASVFALRAEATTVARGDGARRRSDELRRRWPSRNSSR